MKKIILILSILIGLFPKAQQNELLNNTWYLQKVVIDDVEYFQPFDEGEIINTVLVTFNNNVISTTSVCNNTLSNPYTSIDNDSFAVDGFSTTLNQCNLLENEEFENRYFSIYYADSNVEMPNSPYGYTIRKLCISLDL